MTGWVWLGIIIGLAIVALAVGIPYVLTHKTMRDPRELSDSHAYIQTKRRWKRQKSTPSAEPGQTSGRQGTPGSLRTRNGPQA
jgi:hypothetical protein